jgi:hypothetical protein
MKKPCHTCGKEFDIMDLEWYSSGPSVYIPDKEAWHKQELNNGDSYARKNAKDFLKSEEAFFMCPGCVSAQDPDRVVNALRFVTWAWQYDVTTKTPFIYYDQNYRDGQGELRTKRLQLNITPEFTPDMLLSQFTALRGYELTFEKIALVMPAKGVQFFKRKIKGRLKRLQKQWKDREKIREKKDNQRKDKVQEIARGYAEIPRDVIPALVRMSGKSPDELRKIAELVECLAGGKYWQDQAMHREAAELSKVLSVMEA